MKNNGMALLAGIVFGLGLSLSQMTNPNKVLGFLDVTGNWDPSLAFVMIGALLVTFFGFKTILKREEPINESSFHLTNKQQLDKSLLLGSAIFGIGWGLSGYCPGPAVAALGLFSGEALVMVVSIYVGFWANKVFMNKISSPSEK